MKILENEPLAPYTSLRVGGSAEKLIVAATHQEVLDSLHSQGLPQWMLGFGCNALISDSGLPGTTLMLRGGTVTVDTTEIIADAGTWWDDVVQTALGHRLWGLELLSGIPSSTGGAVFGNIAAYGAQVSDTLKWIETYDTSSRSVVRRTAKEITFSYRNSSLQTEPEIIILRAAFKLAKAPVHELRYDSALKIAEELSSNTSTLDGRRDVILETRRRAGSLYSPGDSKSEQTAGSFFKNPLVTHEQAQLLAQFDETGKTLQRVLEQAKIHGGTSARASAAHVLLAAGFQRSQTWNRVRLHPLHVLKLETLPGATATEVAAVVQEIQTAVQEKLGIELEPEVKFMGTF